LGASSNIWIAGEVLIDLLQVDDSELPYVGGGPANTAIAISNLRLNSYFIGGISSDAYGDLIDEHLTKAGVNLTLAYRSQLPTALAKVTFDNEGSASYEFSLDNTATFDFGGWLPHGSPAVLHVGSLSTIVNPGANALFSWASSIEAPIVYDPNVRPSVLANKEDYRKQFMKWAGIASFIKLSQEDLTWLELSIDEIYDSGVELIVLTEGAEGLRAYCKDKIIKIPGHKVDVVDTVGAGDTVCAVIIEGLVKYGELSGDNLEKVLHRAALAAAITCTRAGAKPPTLEELNS
jgi:fructokinase